MLVNGSKFHAERVEEIRCIEEENYKIILDRLRFNIVGKTTRKKSQEQRANAIGPKVFWIGFSGVIVRLSKVIQIERRPGLGSTEMDTEHLATFQNKEKQSQVTAASTSMID